MTEQEVGIFYSWTSGEELEAAVAEEFIRTTHTSPVSEHIGHSKTRPVMPGRNPGSYDVDHPFTAPVSDEVLQALDPSQDVRHRTSLLNQHRAGNRFVTTTDHMNIDIYRPGELEAMLASLPEEERVEIEHKLVPSVEETYLVNDFVIDIMLSGLDLRRLNEVDDVMALGRLSRETGDPQYFRQGLEAIDTLKKKGVIADAWAAHMTKVSRGKAGKGRGNITDYTKNSDFLPLSEEAALTLGSVGATPHMPLEGIRYTAQFVKKNGLHMRAEDDTHTAGPIHGRTWTVPVDSYQEYLAEIKAGRGIVEIHYGARLFTEEVTKNIENVLAKGALLLAMGDRLPVSDTGIATYIEYWWNHPEIVDNAVKMYAAGGMQRKVIQGAMRAGASIGVKKTLAMQRDAVTERLEELRHTTPYLSKERVVPPEQTQGAYVHAA
jgi:hypothetical protein